MHCEGHYIVRHSLQQPAFCAVIVSEECISLWLTSVAASAAASAITAACADALIACSGTSNGNTNLFASPDLLIVLGVWVRFWYCLCELATEVPPLLEEAPAEPDLAVAAVMAVIQSCRSLAVCAARCILCLHMA